METAASVAAVICAAGASVRMGGIKKEYLELPENPGAFSNAAHCGKLTVLGAAVCAFAEVPSIEIIVITVPPPLNGEDTEADARAALPKRLLESSKPKIAFVKGGKTRCSSVHNALSFLSAHNPRYVLIHDGARPWVSSRLIGEIIEKVKTHGAVIPLLAVTETPKEYDRPLCEEENGIVLITRHLKRACIAVAQTPQAFRFPEILHAHEKAASSGEDWTDDAEVWGRFCGTVAAVRGEPENRKITYKEDLETKAGYLSVN